MTISCLLIVILGGTSLGQTPFNVIQLLWINMVMDTLGAIALATEPPAFADKLGSKIRENEPIISPVMFRQIFG